MGTAIKKADIKIAIASGKGGTGKTLVSTNLFHALQQNGLDAKLVDCDAEEPNDLFFFDAESSGEGIVSQKVPVIDTGKCTFCGLCHDYCNYNAIFILPPVKMIKVIDELCHGCGACSVACKFDAIREKDVPLGKVGHYKTLSGAGIIEARMNVGVYSPVTVIQEAIRQSGSDGIIILDAPPGTSCPFIHTVDAADYIILVTEPTPFGLSDLKLSVETLRGMDKRFGVIINRAGLGDRKVYEYLDEEDIPLLMEIPFDKSIASHYSRGEIYSEYNGEWAMELISMLDNIITKHGDSSNKR